MSSSYLWADSQRGAAKTTGASCLIILVQTN